MDAPGSRGEHWEINPYSGFVSKAQEIPQVAFFSGLRENSDKLWPPRPPALAAPGLGSLKPEVGGHTEGSPVV